MPDEIKALEFTVLGDPAPKGSMRAAGNRVLPGGSEANRKNLVSWGTAVREAAGAAVEQAVGVGVERIPFVGVALRMRVIFRVKRPKKHYYDKGPRAGEVRDDAPKYCITKPDGSKLIRAAEDDLNKLVWADDCLVAVHMSAKVYAPPGRPGAWIRIEVIE